MSGSLTDVVDEDEETTNDRKMIQARLDDENALIKASPNYEAYIGSKVTTEDVFYLENPFIVKAMLEHWAGCDQIPAERKRHIVTRVAFEAIKQKQKEHSSSISSEEQHHRQCAIDVEEYQNSEFFSLLRKKMPLIRNKTIQCIVFLRMISYKKEVSGYIDIDDRMHRKKRLRESIAEGTTPLQPLPSDLSFMDWSGCHVLQGGQLNNTRNFHILTSGSNIKFRSKITGLLIDPNSEYPRERTTRTILQNAFPYLQATMFEHSVESDSDSEGEKTVNSVSHPITSTANAPSSLTKGERKGREKTKSNGLGGSTGGRGSKK